MVEVQQAGGRARWRTAAWGTATALLALPLVTNMEWDTADVVLFGVMLLVALGAFEISLQLIAHSSRRAAAAAAIALTFFLVWLELAVGIVGG